jgi:hypothetical protein
MLAPKDRVLLALCYEDLAAGRNNIDIAKERGCHKRRIRRIKEWVEKHGPPKWHVVVIGDAHFKPDQDLSRAALFGKYITEQGRIAMRRGHRFATVVIGDWHDMPAGSSYDKGTIAFEGRSLIADIKAGNDARASMQAHIDPEVWQYMRRRVVVLGNHEYRVQRIVNEIRELEGAFGYGAPGEDTLYRPDWTDHGWEVYPFLEPAFIDNVAFIHYLPNPGNGKAVFSSTNMGRALLLKSMHSVIVGHNHIYRFDSFVDLAGKRMTGLSCGCAFEEEEGWAGVTANNNYDRGLCLLSGLRGSEFSHSFTRFEDLRERYAT